MKNSIAALFLFLSSNVLFAQEEIDMATGLRSSGKIYVVVLVLLTIFAVLGLSLFLLDRRIKKLEK
ncbi:CcmD family protein [Sphingobacterium griseoflavum]|uniref:CcmD family protein n=1 Tax=Sphingobacterium griseoflavum TaxID=1474952 RepID=A0ABQ3HWR1_9SPHI|nr:CcmD family protein [Sphingobacterium griseoflavum]GHE23818.1 hypothetical protein GCM10017764_07860 [Sphingobacterium griseoflavum]